MERKRQFEQEDRSKCMCLGTRLYEVYIHETRKTLNRISHVLRVGSAEGKSKKWPQSKEYL